MVATVQFGQHPPARRVIVHVSDTHLLAADQRLAGRYDTAANLTRTLEAVESLGVRPDAIVFTGDLTDLGEPEAYRALRARSEEHTSELQSLMRISSAVFCLKKKQTTNAHSPE